VPGRSASLGRRGGAAFRCPVGVPEDEALRRRGDVPHLEWTLCGGPGSSCWALLSAAGAFFRSPDGGCGRDRAVPDARNRDRRRDSLPKTGRR
jgi:hypothetical protein